MAGSRVHILLGAALLGLPVGSVYAWSVFVKPIIAANPHWEAGAPVQAFSIFILFLGASSAVVGKKLPTYGSRMGGLFGAALNAFGLGLMCLSVYFDVLPLLLLGAVPFGIGLGSGYVSFIFALRRWFSDRPGFASGYAMMAGSSGSFIFAVINEHILVGLQPGLGVNTPGNVAVGMALYGLAMVALQVLGSFMLTEPPASGGGGGAKQMLTTGGILSSHQFWALWLVFVILLMAMIGVLSILAALMQSVWGVSRITAAWLVALINLCGTFMRLWVGIAADKVGAKRLTYVSLATQLVAFIVLGIAAEHNIFALALVCLICTKIGFGSGFTLINLLVAENFGKPNTSQVFGLMVSGLTVAGVVGPTLLKALVDHVTVPSLGSHGAFVMYCYISSAVMAVGMICNFLARPHPIAKASMKAPLLAEVDSGASSRSLNIEQG